MIYEIEKLNKYQEEMDPAFYKYTSDSYTQCFFASSCVKDCFILSAHKRKNKKRILEPTFLGLQFF